MKKYIYGFLKYLFYKRISKLAFVTNSSNISHKAKINRFSKIYDSTISDYSYVGRNCEIINSTIGKYCSIAHECNIGLATHTINNISTSPIFTERKNGTGFSWINENYVNHRLNKIEIGNDVWIGARVLILNNGGKLKIGDGAIVGAGSIVTKDVPPYTIVVGVPAKIIRYRFNQEVINKLLDIRWWNLSKEVIKSKIALFQSENITLELLEEFKN